MSVYHLNPELYGRPRFYEADRCFNTEAVRKFNQHKILCGEIVSFDCGLFRLFEMESVDQPPRLETRQIMAVITRPGKEPDWQLRRNADFVFCGYDLVEELSSTSAITNCGASFACIDYAQLNEYGLIATYKEAVLTQLALVEEDPDDPHADCEVVEIWRKLI